MSCDLTCIITGHREGRLSEASLRSFDAAIAQARAVGYQVQGLWVLDRPNDLTRQLFADHAEDPAQLIELDLGDQGMARNMVVKQATGQYTAFLDGDDLWSSDWLVQALQFLEGAPDTHIAHPAYNYFFEGQAVIFRQLDQEDPQFSLDLLRIANYWDALCVCPTWIYRQHPFCKRDMEQGWAYEDWHWNCITVAAGLVHKVVPESVLFKRRQKSSQTLRAGQNNALIRRTELASYSSPLYETETKNR